MRLSSTIRDIAGKICNRVIDSLPDSLAVRLIYLRYFGAWPDLKNPRTFNEKIAWRKLYQRDPRFCLYADKIAVKAEVARLIGEPHIVETLWSGDDPGDIPFERLEPPYVIKVNHGNDGHVFVRDSGKINRGRIAATVRGLLRATHARRFREWGYLGIPRKVMVERMITTPDGAVPDDYKFFVYHGRVHFIELDYGRFGGHTRNLYDCDWNLLPVELVYPAIPGKVRRPENLEAMIGLAEKIGRQFDFVRVDLYSLPAGIYFGETTFYPGAGVRRFIPEEWDLRFGEPWNCGLPEPPLPGAPYPGRLS